MKGPRSAWLSQELHSSCSQDTGQDGFAGLWPPAQHFFPPDPVPATTVPLQAGAANPVDVEETHPGSLRKPPLVGGSHGLQALREGGAQLPLALRVMVPRSHSELVIALPLCGGTGPAWGPPHPRLDTGATTPNELDVWPRNLKRVSLGPRAQACPSPAESA